LSVLVWNLWSGHNTITQEEMCPVKIEYWNITLSKYFLCSFILINHIDIDANFIYLHIYY
jgi:hypothetical protein